MKLNEIVQPKPTEQELKDRASLDRHIYGDLEKNQVYVIRNQKTAFKAYIMARLREMGQNVKHFDVIWTSPRRATVFPPAEVRFVVTNRKSELFKGTEIAELFPTIAKGLVKNAFRDVFGFDVKVERVELNLRNVEEYSNGLRYLDFDVTWAAK